MSKIQFVAEFELLDELEPSTSEELAETLHSLRKNISAAITPYAKHGTIYSGAHKILDNHSPSYSNTRRKDIEIGDTVDIVLKKDQPTGKLTRGVVGRILTNKFVHPHGIKVMLTDGQVGRVQKIIEKGETHEL